MKIRKTELKDITKLSILIRKAISNTPYYSKEARREEVRKHNPSSIRQYLSENKYYISLVAEENKKIVGFIIGRNEAGVFWSDWLVVEKLSRRKGIGELLMNKLESNLNKKGVHKIWCDTRTNNKESISLLNKLKYKKLGIFKNGWYKQDFFLWEKNVKN